ncbi:MAG: DNA primase [Balneolaceae bacterium]
MIPDDKKEEIRSAADLVEVVGDYVRLKRSGSGFAGLCPFHEEKTPSFHVTPRLGIYKCFGCGASGDVFSFVMEMEGVGFGEALRSLAERYGVSLPKEASPEDNEEHREREGIYHALRFAGLFYYRQFLELDEAALARDYMQNRGFEKDILKRFGIGYAPGDGNALLKAASIEGIEESFLHKADLIKPSRHGEGWYDTFRGRLIFPIFSPSGKVIAFAGRVLGEEKTAKYINSSQTSVYNKSEVLYGINFARNEIRKREEVYLVEGYTDVMRMVQHGVPNVVASSGTALTPLQIQVLKRYGTRLVMIYDSDSAGQAAMSRGIDIALEGGMEVNLLELPEREDPDSFLKTFGAEAFKKLASEEVLDFVSFLVRKSEESGEIDRPAGRSDLMNRILESIAAIPDELNRQVYVQHLHQMTRKYRNSSDRVLFERLGTLLAEREQRHRRQAKRSEGAQKPPVAMDGPPLPEEEHTGSVRQPVKKSDKTVRRRAHYEAEIIRMMLEHGAPMIRYIGGLCNEHLLEDEEIRLFYLDIIERHRQGEEVSVEHYSHREEPFPRLVGDVMLQRHTAGERMLERSGIRSRSENHQWKSAKSVLKPLRLHYLKSLLRQLAEQSKTADPDEKRRVIRMQARTQREISHIEKTPSGELFPDPEGIHSDQSEHSGSFEYKMRKDKDES